MLLSGPSASTILGLGIIYIIGFISGEVVPWFFREFLSKRESQRKWYETLAELSGRTRTVWSNEFDFTHIDYHTVKELQEIEEELNKLVNSEPDIDSEVKSEANELRIHLSTFTNFYLIRKVEPDNPLLLPDDVDGSGQLGKMRETLDKTKRLSFELHETAQEKSKSGWVFLGVRI